MEGEAYRVISDVHAERSGFVVHKRCRVDGESGHADVQHVAVPGRQRKGRSRERRLLVLPNVVKLALGKRQQMPTGVSLYQTGKFVRLLVGKFSFTFNFKLMLEEETSGEDTME